MSNPRTYKDLRLELRNYQPADETYETALLPGTEWQALFDAPAPARRAFHKAEIDAWLTKLENKNLYVEDQVKLGKALADRLLPDGPMRVAFIRAVEAQGIDQGVRLRLIIRSPELMQIPWEYTYLKIGSGSDTPKDRTHFLVLKPQVSLVRHPPADGPVKNLALTDPTRLRMLAAMANPDAPGFAKLDLDTECGVLERNLDNFKVDGVQLEWKPFHKDITEAELDTALNEKPQIFHFSGHGKFGLQDEQGMVLLVEDKSKNTPGPLEAKALADKLAAHSVYLAYLTACETSRLDGVSGWTGIAPALIAAGMPAVVAMQYKLLDELAGYFSQGFYSALASGLSIDEAVLLGRQAVLRYSTDKGVEWGVPTLYLRAADGVLFPEITQKNSPTAGALRLAVEQIVTDVKQGGTLKGIEFEGTPGQGDFNVRQVVQNVYGNVTGVTISEWPPRRVS